MTKMGDTMKYKCPKCGYTLAEESKNYHPRTVVCAVAGLECTSCSQEIALGDPCHLTDKILGFVCDDCLQKQVTK